MHFLFAPYLLTCPAHEKCWKPKCFNVSKQFCVLGNHNTGSSWLPLTTFSSLWSDLKALCCAWEIKVGSNCSDITEVCCVFSCISVKRFSFESWIRLTHLCIVGFHKYFFAWGWILRFVTYFKSTFSCMCEQRVSITCSTPTFSPQPSLFPPETVWLPGQPHHLSREVEEEEEG